MSSTSAALERSAGSLSDGRLLYLRCARCALAPWTAACASEPASDRHTAVVTPNQRTRFIDPCASLPK